MFPIARSLVCSVQSYFISFFLSRMHPVLQRQCYAWIRITLLRTGLYAQWAASQKLQHEWHFFCLAKKALLHHPGAQTPLHLVGEGFLLFYWNYTPENSYSSCSLRVWFVTLALSKVCKRAKIMFLGVNFQKRSAIPQVTPAFFPICCDSRCDFTSPLPSIILSNLSLVPDKVFMCITWKPSLDLVNE